MRGGKRAGSGRKQWFNMNESQQKKVYDTYSRGYDKKLASGVALGSKLSFSQFKNDYSLRKSINPNKNPITEMIKDSVLVSTKQARAWAKRATEQGLFNDYKSAYREFRAYTENIQALFELVDEFGFKRVMYVD